MEMKVTHRVRITPSEIEVDGQRAGTTATGAEMLAAVYRQRIGGYPKFFKMDTLSRLGFVASELLLEAEGNERFVEREDRAVVMVNRSSSLSTDRRYQQTICSDDYYPSPAQFVYTLPNIVTGEIAIRNKYYGETAFYVVDRKDDEAICRLLAQCALDEQTVSAIGGWLECSSDDEFEAEIFIVEFNK